MPRKLPSKELLIARRAVDGMVGVQILDDWNWNERMAAWILQCRLFLQQSTNRFIPVSTDWYIQVEEYYPTGSIEFFPSKVNGLTTTSRHQMNNGKDSGDLPWRFGNICLALGIPSIARIGITKEPFEPEKRLKWHFERALLWLELEEKNELVTIGDPFELPDFSIESSNSHKLFAFNEDLTSLHRWEKIEERVGIVQIGLLNNHNFFAVCFTTLRGNEIWKPKWGKNLSEPNHLMKGIWILADEVPVLNIWQAPNNWGELRQALREQRLSLDKCLRKVIREIRDDNTHIALIGFPIPTEISSRNHAIHWQAMLLPTLTKHKHVPKGFRLNEQGYYQQDAQTVLANPNSLRWIASENWNIDQLSNRGHLPQSLHQKEILLIGAGALGSMVGESLVRSGIQNLTVIDNDKLKAGNLVRHTLTLDYLNWDKAEAVSHRTNRISPHAFTNFFSSTFQEFKDADQNKLKKYNLIIDCTGSDDVLRQLEGYSSEHEALLFSCSLGLNAKRFYIYSCTIQLFTFDHFQAQVSEWLIRDAEEYGERPLPREGIGCWHPVFPARFDDLALFSSIATKYLEDHVSSGSGQPNLTVFEQQVVDGQFTGVKIVNGSP